MSFLMSTAFAADTAAAAAPHSPNMMSTVIFVGVFFAIFYFLFIRPQSRRQKEARAMLASLATGDEVITTAGIMGKIKEITDQFILLEISENICIKIQKNAIATALPKGTL